MKKSLFVINLVAILFMLALVVLAGENLLNVHTMDSMEVIVTGLIAGIGILGFGALSFSIIADCK